MVQILRQQPFQTFYLTFHFFATTFVRIPLWALLALPKFNRPRVSWTVRRTVMVNTIRHMMRVFQRSGRPTFLQPPNHLALDEGVKMKGNWVSPVSNLIVGDVKEWATAAGVEPTKIPGYWLEKEGLDRKPGEPPTPGEKVLYALHGGGYTAQSAHPEDLISNIARGLIKHADPVQRAFSVEYRLSKGPPNVAANPFPAALLDAIAGYAYLVNEVGFKPDDIIVEGDSAGANLGLALVRYFIENKGAEGMPSPPGALILCSPWSDIGNSHFTEGSSTITNKTSDYIDTDLLRSRRNELIFLGPLGYEAANSNRYISPASVSPSMDKVSFAGFPRTFIQAGGAEVLLDSIRTLQKKMVGDLGEKVEYHEAPDGVHDYIAFLWHEPERTETLRRMAKWISLA